MFRPYAHVAMPQPIGAADDRDQLTLTLYAPVFAILKMSEPHPNFHPNAQDLTQ